MQGQKEPKTKLFYQINLEQFVPGDHRLRRLDELISLEWIRERTKDYYSHTGKPSIDPVVLVKMLLVGYLYDIRSERRLVEEVSLNLVYRWYVGYDLDENIPNHSIFSKARKRFVKKIFVEVFETILNRCLDEGLVGTSEEIFIDSTLVRADASLNSFREVNLDPREYWRELEEEEKPKSPRGRKPKDGTASQLGSHHKGQVDTEKMGRRRRDKKATYLKKRSTTDPDATMHYRPGIGTIPSFKAHAVASKRGVITAVCVTNSACHDTSVLPELIDTHHRIMGSPPPGVAADSNYGTDEALRFLQNQEIKTYIPPMKSRNHGKYFKKEFFHYDPENDAYVCPAKNTLKRKAKNQQTNQIIYKADHANCQICTLKEKCTSAKVRTITRYDSDAAEKANKWCASDEGQNMIRLRQTIIEGLFGQAKTFHGLRRAKLRGLEKLEIQVLMTAAVLNIKKLIAKSLPDENRFSFLSATQHLYRFLAGLNPVWQQPRLRA